MSDEKRVVIACPQCGHQIATAPEHDLPKGVLVCPGCGNRVEAPTPSEALLEEAREKVKDLVHDLVEPSHKRKDSD
jgi:DNA-directed RNA polymerase subunit RPC12/RpoP